MEEKTIVFTNGLVNGEFPMIHKAERQADKSLIVSGCLPGHVWEKGQTFSSQNNYLGWGTCHVLEVIEQRDHNGNFKNAADKKNSYFKIKIVINR